MSENIHLIENVYEKIRARDVDGLFALLDKNVTIVQTPLLPWGGTYSGRAGLLEFFQKILFSVNTNPIQEEYFEAGDSVVVIGRSTGRTCKNDVAFDLRTVHVWTIKKGKVTRFEPYIDTPQMLEALES